MTIFSNIEQSAAEIAGCIPFSPVVGIVLGTGLGSLIDSVTITERIPYSRIPHFPTTTVEGHAGNLIIGKIASIPVVMMQGRFHYYEGYSMQEVTYPIRVLKQLGIRQLFLSNAAGGVNPDFSIGDLMIIRDHINFFIDNPFRGPNLEELGPRFPDMSEPYDLTLIDLAVKTSHHLGIDLRDGIYVGNPGPSFETPAEYTHFRMIGGDVVGMSTIPEVIVANHMDLPVFAVSVVANMAVPGKFEKNSHIDVQIAAEKAARNLADLFREMIRVSVEN